MCMKNHWSWPWQPSSSNAVGITVNKGKILAKRMKVQTRHIRLSKNRDSSHNQVKETIRRKGKPRRRAPGAGGSTALAHPEKHTLWGLTERKEPELLGAHSMWIQREIKDLDWKVFFLSWNVVSLPRKKTLKQILIVLVHCVFLIQILPNLSC